MRQRREAVRRASLRAPCSASTCCSRTRSCAATTDTSGSTCASASPLATCVPLPLRPVSYLRAQAVCSLQKLKYPLVLLDYVTDSEQRNATATELFKRVTQ